MLVLYLISILSLFPSYIRISADHKNWTYTIRAHQLSVPSMYSEELYTSLTLDYS